MSEKAVATLFMPLQRSTLALPKAAIAEIIAYKPPMPSAGPRWLLGKLEWRGIKIPMVSFEAMCGSSLPIFNTDARIAVLYNVMGDREVPYFAMLLQSSPKNFILDDANAQYFDPPNPCQFISGGVAVDSDNAVIPDMERMSAALLQLRIF